ncbi:collagen alpha-1(III) chain-like [Sorex araneus]|uniref:collagen alpha-1(III) chain-like n=1 Tax=Sorex araneus TaxID=42254 RepID=UPI002433DB91|nr:collagen alpha-1(III) chain-like [Sorex araneus]
MPRCLRLPCSAQQALALYQHLFGCPAGLGQLQAALQQVPESRACPPGLELPITLLAMEQSRWAQEQLLWDLELLTGAGLGLFWPPQAHSSSLWGRGVRSWWDEPPGSTVGGPERRVPFPELRTGSRGISGEPGGSELTVKVLGVPRTRVACPPGGRLLGETGHFLPSWGGGGPCKVGVHSQARDNAAVSFQDLTPRGERGEAGVVTPSAQGTSGLPEPRGPGWVLYGERGRELAELEKLLRIEGPQRQKAAQPREETPERPRGEVSGGQSGEDPRGESPRTGALPEPTPQGQEESLSSGGRASRAQEEGDSLDTRGHSGSSPGERTPQPGGRESPGPRGRTTPPLLPGQEPGPAQEGAGGPHSARCPGAATRAARRAGDSELREGPESAGSPAREEGGEAGAPEPPRAPRAAWTRAPGVSAAQQESALQRLLELHRAARRRRGREREQQRLRVLEGLRIARNRRCRVHPLGPPLQQAQLPLQEDAAGQRRALREQLQQVHLERTRRLWTQGARNTQNFQQLLCPSSTSEPELLDPQKEMGALQRNT